MLVRRPSSTLFPYTTLFRSTLIVLSATATMFILLLKVCLPFNKFRTVLFLTMFAVLIALVFFRPRSEEHTSELQSRGHLVCRLLLEKKNDDIIRRHIKYEVT